MPASRISRRFGKRRGFPEGPRSHGSGGVMKVAIVTGASAGIGQMTAAKLVEMGMAVLGVGRDPARVEETKAMVKDKDRLEMMSLDLTEKDAPKRVVDAVLKRWGKIDYLVNNAGAGRILPLLE